MFSPAVWGVGHMGRGVQKHGVVFLKLCSWGKGGFIYWCCYYVLNLACQLLAKTQCWTSGALSHSELIQALWRVKSLFP